jgi:Ca2+-transporting ATPase
MAEKNQYPYHNIFDSFDSSEHGLDSNEAVFRLKKYGPNQIVETKQKSLIISFLEEFRDPMMILLIFATIFAYFSGDTTDAIIILAVLMLNGTISFIQKYKAEKAVDALKRMVSPSARVLRNRQQVLIPTNEIVPGDIIIVNEGDTIPADAIVFQANELETSEAILTGESSPVRKNPYDTNEKGNLTNVENIIFTGTTVSRGNAKALVVKTGMESEFGKIANLTQETKKDATPLEKEIHKLGIFAAQITLIIIAIIFAFELLVHHRPIVDNILFATSIAVAAVPEGMPAVITIALALGVQRLSRKKAIIRQLSSVETLGATTVICTDKTGTLTKNEMVVTEALVDDFYLHFEGIGYEPKGKYQIFTSKEDTFEIHNNLITPEFKHKHANLANPLHWMSLCAVLCNNANLTNKNGSYQILGDPTEGGLLSMGLKINRTTEQELAENWHEVHELPFDSTRKMMSKIFLDRQHNKYYVFSKGAPENVISASDQRLHLGRLNILTKGVKEELMTINEKFNEDALRTIALAYKEISSHELAGIINQKDFESKVNAIEKKLVFIGIAGLFDPPRAEIKEAVRLTQIAGIRSYIITGDNGFTTAAIAKQVGLISEKKPHEIINGSDLERITDEELKNKFADRELDIIFARSKPEHKLRLVSLLKDLGEIVAVTGDGVNDAPALKRADIGVAMGITGSDVSKEAANMVLMDDSYSTIVTAIEEGRVIFSNLKKFIFYIFSSNIGEVFAIFFALIIGLESPLSAVLILTINFATDLFPALALGIEPAEKNIMKMPPRQADEKLMTHKFIRRILFTGSMIGLMVLLLYISRLLLGGWTYGQPLPEPLYLQASSLAFIAMVMFQVTNSFNAKTENNSVFSTSLFNNPKLIWANLSSVLMAVLIVELPLLQGFFHTSSLSLLDWGLIAIGCVIITIILEIAKLLTRRTAKSLLSKSHV